MRSFLLAAVALLAAVVPATAQRCSSCLIGECASVCSVEPTTLYLGGMFALDPRDLTGGQVRN